MDDKEIFWTKMGTFLKCSVPDHIKNVVERTGYINPALEDLTDERISRIETDIRALPEAKKVPMDPNLRKYMDSFTEDITDFRLMAGERALLLKMAQAIKRKDWSYFTQRQGAKRVVCADESSRNKDAESLRLRIFDYYTQRNDGSEKFNDLMESLPNLLIQFDSTSNDRFFATCVVCQDAITCNIEKSGSWKISNYTAHIRKHHLDNTPHPLKKRRTQLDPINSPDIDKEDQTELEQSRQQENDEQEATVVELNIEMDDRAGEPSANESSLVGNLN